MKCTAGSKTKARTRNVTFRNASPSATTERNHGKTEVVTMGKKTRGRSSVKGARHSEVTLTPASQHNGETSTSLDTANNHEADTGGQDDSQTAVPTSNDQESRSLSGEEPLKKRSRTWSSNTDKLADWLHVRDEFLDIILQHEGIPDGCRDPACSNCGLPTSPTTEGQSVVRCLDCFNTSQVLCQSCSLHQHKHLPFHCIEKWNGTFFVKSLLYELGLVRQLGHEGSDCPNRAEKLLDGDIQTLQVIHTTGVFKLSVRYCGCRPNMAPRYRQLLRERLFPASLRRIRSVFTFDILDTFHSLNLDGKITSYDYYNHILQKTDFLELAEQPSQLNNFNCTIRIWRHMMGLKRSGCAHSPSGTSGTELGGTLVECPLCPHPEKNLPSDWDADTADACISLHIDRGLNDIELGSGWGAFVEQEPYMKHIAAKVDEPEINTCNSEHDAILRAATRSTPGYSVSGVGLVICSRHCLICRNGAGDLQKGEKYCNMDYILFSSLSGINLQHVVITYDIACQWSHCLQTRMQDLPTRLHIPDHVDVQVAVPSWHINGHGKSCQERYNVGYMPEVGRLCGDEIEQMWWTTNGLGVSVWEMSSPARHEVINDHWNYFNICKIVGFRFRFARKLKEADRLSQLHKENFEKFSATFNDEAVAQWEEMTLAWEQDQTQPNPYEEKEPGLTLQDVQLQLAAEEETAARAGEVPAHKISMSSFLLTGLEIEDQQRLLKDELLESSKPTTQDSADLQQKRTALLQRLNGWCDVQKSYMPCVTPLVEVENASEPPAPECTKLFLPSSLPDTLHLTAEVVLEEIQCLLRAETNLSTFKKLNLAGEGNKANTRAHTLYDRLTKKKHNAAARYRSARDALLILDPKGDWSVRLLELKDEDMRPLGKEDPLEGLNDTEKENRKKKLKTHHLIPWIWLVIGPNTKKLDDEAKLDVTAQVQWAKARTRALRWEEELKLIVEEMRRCIAYLEWRVRWWERCVGLRTEVGSHLQSGLQAYALKQADYARRLAGACAVYWALLLHELGFGNGWCMNYIPFTSPPSKPHHSLGPNMPPTGSVKTSCPVTEASPPSEAELSSEGVTEGSSSESDSPDDFDGRVPPILIQTMIRT
ncbi:hypothetical protein BJ165DRAFT_1531802 [Panaeolus papilionaceus]|nr:hypothetical protein BJ165DRAFT_1531802 [Panaeolus papilionaceus]